jgi:hypothetical protein
VTGGTMVQPSAADPHVHGRIAGARADDRVARRVAGVQALQLSIHATDAGAEDDARGELRRALDEDRERSVVLARGGEDQRFGRDRRAARSGQGGAARRSRAEVVAAETCARRRVRAWGGLDTGLAREAEREEG